MLLALLPSCAAGKIPPIVTYADAIKEIDGKQLVPPKIEDEKDFQAGTSDPVPTGATITYKDKDGNVKTIITKTGAFVIDRDRASYYAQLKARRDRLRADLETSLKKQYVDRRILESTVENVTARAKAEATWWERNKGLVGLATGTVLGMGIVVGLVYALTRGNGATTTTANSHILRW